MRHVAVMTLTSSFGLVTMFSVDLLDLYFISLLGDPALTAAMGFAATLLFFNSALNIGLMIAISALASRMIGQGKAENANALLTHVIALGLSLSIPVAIIFWLFAPQFMDLIGAEGEAKQAAIQYIRIVAPFGPVTICGMIGSGFLRAYGDARRAMNTTLAMAITNAVFDPLLMFGFGLGFAGAAYATMLSIFAMALAGLLPVIRLYGGFGKFERSEFSANLPAIRRIMGPAILTNLATPLGGFITFGYIASYSDDVVASYAIIGRIIPVAFCLLFSLSGAIGPIVGQNYGAANMQRVREAMNRAVIFAAIYTLLIWPILYIMVPIVGAQFGLGGAGVELLNIFAIIVVPLFLFNGILYISNAAFNNLDRASWSTWLNWGRNTLGILPFIYFGELYFGAAGVVAAPALGGVIFGLLGYALALRLIRQREDDLAVAASLP